MSTIYSSTKSAAAKTVPRFQPLCEISLSRLKPVSLVIKQVSLSRLKPVSLVIKQVSLSRLKPVSLVIKQVRLRYFERVKMTHCVRHWPTMEADGLKH